MLQCINSLIPNAESIFVALSEIGCDLSGGGVTNMRSRPPSKSIFVALEPSPLAPSFEVEPKKQFLKQTAYFHTHVHTHVHRTMARVWLSASVMFTRMYTMFTRMYTVL